MQYFTKQETRFTDDNIGLASAFAHVLKRVVRRVPNLSIDPSNPYFFLTKAHNLETVNICGLSQLTSFSKPRQSIQNLYENLPGRLKRYFEYKLFCPSCQRERSGFRVLEHDAFTVQQHFCHQFCEQCHCPLELLRPPMVAIFERKASPLQLNYWSVKQIPEELRFFSNEIRYRLGVLLTRDLMNDVCQCVVADDQSELRFNKTFDCNEQQSDLRAKLGYYIMLNQYATLLPRTSTRYFFLKQEMMREFLDDCSFGHVNRMIGEAQFYFYFLESQAFLFEDEQIFLQKQDVEERVPLTAATTQKHVEPAQHLQPARPDRQVTLNPNMPANNCPHFNAPANELFHRQEAVRLCNPYVEDHSRFADYGEDEKMQTFQERMAAISEALKRPGRK